MTRDLPSTPSPPAPAPTVSVILPVYNAEAYLVAAVESILNQTFRDFEFLITDDGSTDRSAEILRGYAARDPRISLVRRPNTGYVTALIEMLARARGEFVARMDADDIATPDRFALQVEYLRSHPECVALGSGILFIDSDGDPIQHLIQNEAHEDLDALQMSGQSGVIHHPAVMLRRAAVVAIGGYREEFRAAEDYDLFLRLAEVGRLANYGRVLLHYRLHDRSVTHTQRDRQIEEVTRSLRDAYARRGLVPPDPVPCKLPPCPPAHIRHIVWGWTAYGQGYTRTAWKHAWRAIRCAPLSSYAAWRLAAQVLIKPARSGPRPAPADDRGSR